MTRTGPALRVSIGGCWARAWRCCWLRAAVLHFWVRTAGSVIGSALVVRAASGSEGLSKLVRYLPIHPRGVR